MTKRILILSFIATLGLMAPQIVNAGEAEMPAVEQVVHHLCKCQRHKC